ncbi:hypothetical protein K402DRAFT_388157 [Aulographum hederae CBS 113979]|uniref:EthD domain-containing protein n=1 Tax=Aulographum hederae CBS 113979 TaxID=1176131 RepID=A0A6G1HGY7_9PEZI|nr:hypothetical protein K402DRAFT_388157 [Aulographum hederae CBS 113979]
MPATATVLYATKPSAHFDMSYYLHTHMPLVASSWGQYGLKSYTVTDFRNPSSSSASASEEAQPPFLVQCVLFFDDVEGIKKAVESVQAKDVFGDVKKFTDIEPTFLMGTVSGEVTL